MAVYDGQQITKIAWSLLQPKLKQWNEWSVRQIGVSVHDLISLKGTESLFKGAQDLKNTLLALDKVSGRFGQGSWQRLSTLPTSFKERVSGWHYDHED